MEIVNVFLASPEDDAKFRTLTAEKINQWNKLHCDNKYNFYAHTWKNDTCPITRPEPCDGQFIINKETIDKCEILIAIIINGGGTPYTTEDITFPCATLYEVYYHSRTNKKISHIFINDKKHKTHYDFITRYQYGLFYSVDESNFENSIYETIDKIFMQYSKEKEKKMFTRVDLIKFQKYDKHIFEPCARSVLAECYQRRDRDILKVTYRLVTNKNPNEDPLRVSEFGFCDAKEPYFREDYEHFFTIDYETSQYILGDLYHDFLEEFKPQENPGDFVGKQDSVYYRLTDKGIRFAEYLVETGFFDVLAVYNTLSSTGKTLIKEMMQEPDHFVLIMGDELGYTVVTNGNSPVKSRIEETERLQALKQIKSLDLLIEEIEGKRWTLNRNGLELGKFILSVYTGSQE